MKRLLLLGAGHAQLAVLAALARRRIPGAEVVLVSPNERFIYSGRVPGLIAGRFDESECSSIAAETGSVRHGATMASRDSRCVIV